MTIERDPEYADAWGGLAETYVMLGIFGLKPPNDAFPAARSAAERALALNGSSAQALIVTLFGGVGIFWGPVIGSAILIPLAETLHAELCKGTAELREIEIPDFHVAPSVEWMTAIRSGEASPMDRWHALATHEGDKWEHEAGDDTEGVEES